MKLFIVFLFLGSNSAFSAERVSKDFTFDLESLLYADLPTYTYKISYKAWRGCSKKGVQTRAARCFRNDGRIVNLDLCSKVQMTRRCKAKSSKKTLPFTTRWVRVYDSHNVVNSKKLGTYPNGTKYSYAGPYKYAFARVKSCKTRTTKGYCATGWNTKFKKKWSLMSSFEFKNLKSKGYHVWKGFPTKKQGKLKINSAYPVSSGYFGTIK